MSAILVNIENNVAFLTFNRPEKFNSFNLEMSMDLQRILDECADNDDVRAIYLTGVGKAFCAGQDLAEAIDPNGPDLRTIVRDHYNPIIERIRNIEKPVIAAVNGVAAGAGANIALVCDIVIAKESAAFIQAFSKIGLIPDSGGTFFLPRLIGFQKAMALMMLGDKVMAEEAERLGMIYKYYADDNFETESKNIALNLAKMPTKALAYTKIALNKSLTNNLSEQLQVEEDLQALAAQTDDFTEGIAAFLEKRKPVFQGK